MKVPLLASTTVTVIFSKFLNNRTNCYVGSKCMSSVSGNSLSINKRLSMLAAFGEYLEREAFFYNNPQFSDVVYGYSMLQNKPVAIDNKYVKEQSLFLDTCGLASHTNSRDCLHQALDEFIERQSYIFNYLTKSPGEYISIDLISQLVGIESLFKELEFFNISIIEDYYVILGKGLIAGQFYIGLGASGDIKTAISRCVKELSQMRYMYKQLDKQSRVNSSKTLYDYMDIFLSLSTEQVETAYRYLSKDNPLNPDTIRVKNRSVSELMSNLSERCKMDPIICFVMPPRESVPQKVLHVIDLNWFPNMFPKKYTEKVYSFVEDVMKVKLDRRCTVIPFP